MNKYYFTYGTSHKMPYVGGWTEIEAETLKGATELFKLVYPSNESTINCAGIYSEAQFKQTDMFLNGNFGVGCREKIKLNVEVSNAY